MVSKQSTAPKEWATVRSSREGDTYGTYFYRAFDRWCGRNVPKAGKALNCAMRINIRVIEDAPDSQQ
jgi:hypothetical protein